MGDYYQAVYDAIRSRFPHVDVSGALDRCFNTEWQYHIQQAANIIVADLSMPFMRLKPTMTREGDAWKCRYGDVVGTGESPYAAEQDFNKQWDRRIEKDQTPPA